MRILLLAAALGISILPATSQEKNAAEPKKLPRIAIFDPAKLKDNKEFATNGEYKGSLTFLEEKKQTLDYGMNLVARGSAQFEIVLHEAGLPGATDRWKRLDVKLPTYSLKNKMLVDEASKETMSIVDGKLSSTTDKSTSFRFSRVERKSPTLCAKPPEGAIVLFGGPEDVAKWDEKASIVELSDGKFLGVGGRTRQKFQSFTLHLEFRLPWMPNSRGQERANSGVYVQDRYEIQVLDSFGHEGLDNECGGIYKEAKPKVNMCYPPMTWQTYDIDFTAAQFENGKKTKNAIISVKHNGVVIHDKLSLKNNTPGGAITREVPEPGSLFLQDHGDPVVYRNIWIMEKK